MARAVLVLVGMSDYDAIVIGTGNAGLAAAKAMRSAGWSVAAVERDLLGGTCSNRGCVPKKILVAAAQVMDEIARAEHHGITAAGTLDWGALIERKRALIRELPDRLGDSLRQSGVDVLRGEARFVGRRAVDVGGRVLTARKVIVAVGSRPRPLQLAGADLLTTSDELLELDTLPDAVAFLGAGVVAMELAHVVARAGARAIVLEQGPRPLLEHDADAVAALVAVSRDVGIDIEAGVAVEKIERDRNGGDRFVVHYRRDGKPHTHTVGLVVHGAGRVPDLEPLALAAAEIELDDAGVPAVQADLSSRSNPDVLFAGDSVPGSPKLSPVATYEGDIAGHNAITGDDLRPTYRTVPSVVFTIPALAGVGLTAEEAERLGVAVELPSADMTSWLSSRTHAERAVFGRLVLSAEDGTILGAHLLGHDAAEVINTMSLAMRCGATATDLTEHVWAYPTFTSDVKNLL